jgi:hypothetical protein
MFPIGGVAGQRYSRILVLDSPQKASMETLSKLFSGTSRLIRGGRPYPPLSTIDPRSERHFMKPSSGRHPEWTVLRTSPVNALLVGGVQMTAVAVARVERSLRQPLVWWSPEQIGDAPALTDGTLVIRDVDRLDAQQQALVTHWINTHSPRVQVIALAREPLFPHVAAGRFSAALYYRVNTVVVELRTPADLP